MRIGAHVSSAGGPHTVFERATAMGAEAVQLFLGAPQQWRMPVLDDDQVARFRDAHAAAAIPAFFHAVYLVNLGSADTVLLERSLASLRHALTWASTLGVEGVVYHVGSHLGAGFAAMAPQACRLMREALDGAPGDALLILENNAGQGNCMGATFAELGQLIRGAGNDPRIAVCLDTCHAFAMGYDIATTEGCGLAMEEFGREIGLERLRAVHANDSKMPLGGVRDRHENIGDGHIGYDGFRVVMSHPAFADVPFLLEVPGIADKGPDAENIARLKRIRAEISA